MAKGKTYKTQFRRRREKKTNYSKRLSTVKSGKVKMTVRKTNKRIVVQAIKYNPIGDETLVSATSTELTKFGFKGNSNTPSAYLTGLLAGKRLLAKDVSTAIGEIGFKTPSKGGVVFAAIQGVSDSGVKIPIGKESVPSEDRLTGKKMKKDVSKEFEKAKEEVSKVKK